MSDLYQKYMRTLAALPKSDSQKLYPLTWEGYRGLVFGKSSEVALEIEKSRIHALADTEIHALQIIDLAQDNLFFLQLSAQALSRGDDPEGIIERLLDGLRYEPESFEKMIKAYQPKEDKEPNWLSGIYLGPIPS